MYRIVQNCGGGELWRIWRTAHHSPIFFTQPNSRLLKVATVSYCKFVNIFLTKSSETIDSPKFSPATILRYTVYIAACQLKILNRQLVDMVLNLA